jgi:serine/threonine protein kinase
MAAAGGGGGAAAGAGGGAALDFLANVANTSSLVDCGKSVLRFAQMINVRFQSVPNPNFIMTSIIIPLMEDSDPRPPIIIANSLSVLDNPRHPDGHGDLQYLTRPDGTVVKGAYGNMIISRSDPNIIWKEINYIRTNRYGHTVNILPMVLIESFIQFILADAYKGSDFVIPVLDIRKASDGQKKIYICMQRAENDVFGLLQRNIKSQNGSLRLPDKLYYNVVSTILINLIDYNTKFNLVHRDAKSDNFVYVKSEGMIHIKMIDFGFACIDIKVGDNIYNVKTTNNNYVEETPCAAQQDALVLLFELELIFGKYFSEKTRRFYEAVIQATLRDEMTRRQAPFAARQTEHMASYNKDGTLTVRDSKPAHYLTPSFALETLASVFSSPMEGGRRRRKNRTRH